LDDPRTVRNHRFREIDPVRLHELEGSLGQGFTGVPADVDATCRTFDGVDGNACAGLPVGQGVGVLHVSGETGVVQLSAYFFANACHSAMTSSGACGEPFFSALARF
jgi:hypothetical protein